MGSGEFYINLYEDGLKIFLCTLLGMEANRIIIWARFGLEFSTGGLKIAFSFFYPFFNGLLHTAPSLC